MKLMYKKTATIFLSFLLLFGAVNFVLASEAGDSLTNGLVTLFTNVLKFSAFLSACVVAVGGLFWLASFGNSNLKSEGTDLIKSGILGLLIVMCSWLIAYTINPKLLIFDINGLTEFGLGVSQGPGSATSPFEPKKLLYDEIPIGMLSENLLARKVNCYEFDMNGDPVAGEFVEPDNGKKIRGPTYVEHDRVECYLKLVEAVEKKSLIAEELSKQIMGLMDFCACAEGNCENQCLKDGADEGCKLNESETGCEGACTKPATAGCLNSSTNSKDAHYWSPNTTSLSSCPQNIRNIIQGYWQNHGDGIDHPYKDDEKNAKKRESMIQPFEIGMAKECENCSSDIKEKYYGLDEFYTNKSNFANIVEKTVQVDDEDFDYIDLKNGKKDEWCTACVYTCDCKQGDKDCEKNKTKCDKDYQTCLTNRQKCLAETPWGKLNLVEQISYLTEKMEEAKQAVTEDLKNLQKAKSDLSKCNMPQSYIDLRKVEESTDENLYKFEIVKKYKDPKTNEEVDASKYCNGFNYSNSQCDQMCSDICPITEESTKCYADAPTCKEDSKDYQECLKKRNQKINECYTSRKCKYGDSKDFKDYKECVTRCDTSCVGLCSVKYLKCSKEYELCKSACEDNSTCLLNNIDKCILDPEAISTCESGGDKEATEQCIQNSYLCEYGSSQYSGYPECLKDPKNEPVFTSSYIWQNKDKQVCKNPYAPDFPLPAGGKGFCIQVNPKTSKCPASSWCPDCSCNYVKAELDFYVEGLLEPHELDLCKEGEDEPGAPVIYPECEEYESKTTDQEVEEYRIVGPECNEYLYNDDPLTFYCRQDWWKDPETKRTEPLAGNLSCSSSKNTPEIPVGNMVENSIKWANNFLALAGKASESAKKMIDTLKVISNDQKYCQCDSKYLSGNPVCKTCCNFIEKQPATIDAEGNIVTPEIPASCNIDACKGNSCQGIIIKLEEVLNRHTEIKETFIELYIDLITDSRTDVLKELTYSRNQVNICSSAQNLVGRQKVRMLSCQRVLDDIVPPVTNVREKTIIDQQEIYHYCYGQSAGAILGKGDLLDNWFCCEQTAAKTTPETYEEAISNAHQSGAGGGFVQ